MFLGMSSTGISTLKGLPKALPGGPPRRTTSLQRSLVGTGRKSEALPKGKQMLLSEPWKLI